LAEDGAPRLVCRVIGHCGCRRVEGISHFSRLSECTPLLNATREQRAIILSLQSRLKGAIKKAQELGAHAFRDGDVRDTVILAAARLLQSACGFLLSIVVIRRFGLSAAGVLTLSLIATTVMATVLTFGSSAIMAQSKIPIEQKNFVGLCLALFGVALNLPVSLAFGFLLGRSNIEALEIVVLSMSGAYFAHTIILNSLAPIQKNIKIVVIPAIGNLLAIGVAAIAAPDMFSFAVVMVLGRFLSTATAFVTLRVAVASARDTIKLVRSGWIYLYTETTSLFLDQGAFLLTSIFLTREQLGILGVCRQFVFVGDNVAWSRLLMVYPSMCNAAREVLPRALRQMVRLSMWVTPVLMLGSIVAGLLIYQEPLVAIYAPIALLALVPSYIAGTHESILRAVRDVAGLWRLMAWRVAVVPIPILSAMWGGVTGVIVASLVVAVFTALYVRRLATLAISR
jgi:hypothetical protein